MTSIFHHPYCKPFIRHPFESIKCFFISLKWAYQRVKKGYCDKDLLFGVENWLVEMLSGDIARAIDDYIINDTTNGIVKMVSTATTNKITQSATAGYGYADICNLVSLLPAGYDAEAKFLVSKKVLYNDIKGILDTNKRPIFDPVEKTLFGYPVVVDDYVPSDKKQVFLGKWTDVVGNLSQPINVARSDQSGFLNNSIDFRGTAIFDSKLAKNDAIVWLANA